MARPTKDAADKRTRTIQVRVSPTEEAKFLSRAVESGQEPAVYARTILCGDPIPGRELGARGPSSYELVDQLMRIGTELQRLRSITERTGVAPESVSALCERLETVLDKVLTT